MPILPRPLPNEVVKGEHFVIADLLKLLPRGLSQAKVVLEPLVWLDYLPLAVQDPKPTHQEVTKKKKKKSGLAKASGEGLEGFVDWTNQTAQEGTSSGRQTF